MKVIYIVVIRQYLNIFTTGRPKVCYMRASAAGTFSRIRRREYACAGCSRIFVCIFTFCAANGKIVAHYIVSNKQVAVLNFVVQ